MAGAVEGTHDAELLCPLPTYSTAGRGPEVFLMRAQQASVSLENRARWTSLSRAVVVRDEAGAALLRTSTGCRMWMRSTE
jgi:hypothetical protein